MACLHFDLTLPDGWIKIRGDITDDPDPRVEDAAVTHVEIAQPEHDVSIVIKDPDFGSRFLRHFIASNEVFSRPTDGVLHATANVSLTQNLSLSGVLIGFCSANGHLIVAINDFQGNQRVAYLDPSCNAFDFFRRNFLYHPVTACGVPTPAGEALYRVDSDESLFNFVSALHLVRLTPNDGEGTPVRLHGTIAGILAASLFRDFLFTLETRQHLARAIGAAYTPTAP